MRFLEMRRGKMRVNLRGREARMAKHFLHATQIGVALEQIGGKGVPHVMGAQPLIESGLANSALEHDANRIGAHGVSPHRHEEAVRGRSLLGLGEK